MARRNHFRLNHPSNWQAANDARCVKSLRRSRSRFSPHDSPRQRLKAASGARSISSARVIPIQSGPIPGSQPQSALVKSSAGRSPVADITPWPWPAKDQIRRNLTHADMVNHHSGCRPLRNAIFVLRANPLANAPYRDDHRSIAA